MRVRHDVFGRHGDRRWWRATRPQAVQDDEVRSQSVFMKVLIRHSVNIQSEAHTIKKTATISEEQF